MSSTDAGNLQRSPWLWPRAGYVHVPFCAHHCGYCDFAIAVGQDNFIESYLDALAIEMARLGSPQPVDTLFLGGGTPTLLGRVQLRKLLSDIVHWLPPQAGQEFSVESNPGTLDADKVAVLADHGVTRVSLGVQTFQPHLLHVLERDHVPADVPRAIEAIRARIPLLSLDLIFGVPGQTLAEWEADLELALAFAPDHVSTYGLTYEKGTPLWKQRERGQVLALAEDQELSLYARAIDILEANGYEQYEISSFARPGRRCRHNRVYWANHAYFGFGMGAARYVEGCREVNTRDLRTYLRRIEAGQVATFQSEQLLPRERAFETLSLNLRRREGIDSTAFQEQTGFIVEELAGRELARLVGLGYLEKDARGVRLTRQGRYVADAVIAELLRSCDTAGR